MPIIFSYPQVSTVSNQDLFVISRTSSGIPQTKSVEAEDISTYVKSTVDLNILGDSGTGSVNLDTQSLTISGTSNEIETSASSQTLQIGLPDNVTITNNLTVGADLTVSGLTETGTLQVNTTASIGSDTSISGSLDILNTLSVTDNQGNGSTIDSLLSMDSNRIINLSNPTGAQDAVTKSYVDTLVSGGLNFRGSFRADTGQILSGSNTGSYLYTCPPNPATRIAIMTGDYYIVANDIGPFYCSGDFLNAGDSVIAVADAAAGSSTVNDWATLESDNIEGTGIANTVPVWTDSQVLGDSAISQTIDGMSNVSSVTINTSTGGISANYFFGPSSFQSPQFDFKSNGLSGGYYRSGNFRFEENLAVGRTNDPMLSRLDVGASTDSVPAAFFRNGVVISNNPAGVQVDNTSMVIGAGNNDNVSGSDHCLIVGSGNQITSNSDQSVAFGQGNSITNSNDAFAVGNSNTLASSLRTQALGFNNTIQASSSFIAGGDNNISTSNSNIMVLGYDNSIPSVNTASGVYIIGGNNQPFVSGQLKESFGVGNNLTLRQNIMTLGYRNNASGYPATNKNLGLGETKFVVGVGSSTITDANALIITEGGINGGSSGSVPQIPRVILPSVVGFNFADDTAAAAGGIPVGGLYHNAGALRIRLT